MKLDDLNTLIPQYASNKSEFESYKKICEKENAKIKTLMKQFNITDYEAGDYVASYGIQHRETINEEMLLEIAHTYNIPEIVKTKEYIDFDALENAIYNDKIDKEILLEIDKTRIIKDVPVLRIKRKGDKTE